jgi:hypothetical protein
VAPLNWYSADELIKRKLHPQTIVADHRLGVPRGAGQHCAHDAELQGAVCGQVQVRGAGGAAAGGLDEPENIQVIKKVGGKLLDSYLDEGFILDKKTTSPRRWRTRASWWPTRPWTRTRSSVRPSWSRLSAPRRAPRSTRSRFKAHGITCFVNRQLIYNFPEQLFAEYTV